MDAKQEGLQRHPNRGRIVQIVIEDERDVALNMKPTEP